MGWSSTNPGGSYTKKYGTVKSTNYYSLKYELYVARLTNNNISVKVVCTPAGKGSTDQGPYYPAYQYFNTGSDSVFMAGENTNTKYWTGTLNAGSKKRFNLGYSNSKPTMDGQVFYEWDVTGPAYTTQYSITYNANGGSGYTAPSTFTYGSSTTVSYNGFTAPSGMHFVGWKDGNGNSYAVGASYSTAANLTLYAQWAWNTYTVSYNGNSPDGTSVTNLPGAQTKTHGTALTLSSAEPSCEGFVFSHWNTAADDSGTSYAPGASFNTNANTVLYAIWFGTWPVAYNGNGATSGSTAGQTKIEGQTITIQPNGFVRDKYTFVQWNTASDGSGTAYDPGDPYTTNAALTLYAIWLKNNIPVFYHDGETVRQVEKAFIMKNGEVLPVTLYIKKNDVVYEVS